MTKRTLSILAASAIVLTSVLTACSTGTEPAVGSSSSGDKPTQSGSTQSQTQEPAKIEKFDPPITITSVRITPNPATQDYQSGDDAENNAWTRRMLEKYGINLKYEWMSGDGNDYNTKVSLMLSSGDLPDFFQAPAKQFTEMVDADLLQPLDDTWKYANANLKNIIEVEGGEKVIQACTIDEKLMAIPFTGNPKENVPLLFFRTDWMKNLNLAEPKSLEEVYAIAEAFAANDPDKNGKNDTYAVQLDQTIYSMVQALFNGNNSYPGNHTMGSDGKLVDNNVTEETRQVIAKLNEWYSKGYIDKEWFTKDNAKASEMVNTGKVGIISGSFPTPLYPLQAGHDTDSKVDWTAVPAPAAGGGLSKAIYSLGIVNYWVASKECKNPEAVVMMMNEWVDIFYYNTDEALHKELVNSESGAEIWLNAPVTTYRGLKNMDCGIIVSDYFKNKGTTDKMTPEQKNYVSQIEKYNSGDQSMWAWNKIFGIDGTASMIKSFVDSDSYIFSEFWGSSTETMLSKGAIIDKLVLESFTGFITGEKPMSEWDSFVKQYNELGGAKILEEVSAWWSEKNS